MSYLLLIPYLIFAIYIVVRVTRRRKTLLAKTGTVLLVSFLLYLPLGWDVILGRAYFNYLCATQGGVHVYQTVKLGKEYFDEEGVSGFYDKNKRYKDMRLGDKYKGSSYYDRNYSTKFNIAYATYSIHDVLENKVLGSVKVFTYFGGWFINHTGFHVVGESCFPDNVFDEKLRQLPTSVFLKD